MSCTWAKVDNRVTTAAIDMIGITDSVYVSILSTDSANPVPKRSTRSTSLAHL
jgi:hypothetical protein